MIVSVTHVQIHKYRNVSMRDPLSKTYSQACLIGDPLCEQSLDLVFFYDEDALADFNGGY